MSRIVSSIPGRIRVRDKKLRKTLKLHELKNELAKIATISELQHNEHTGSLLIRFNPKTVALETLEADINLATDKVLGKITAQHALFSKKNINRYNKIAMLISLGISLAYPALRPKRWKRKHILTSYLFLANLGLHLAIYRKSLLRLFQ